MVQALRVELLELGRTITEEQLPADEVTPLLEKYVGLFQRWQETDEFRMPIKANKKALEELQRVHNAVLAFTGRFKAKTEKDIKSLKQKKKGVLAYIDTLPKRVSITKTHKG